MEGGGRRGGSSSRGGGRRRGEVGEVRRRGKAVPSPRLSRGEGGLCSVPTTWVSFASATASPRPRPSWAINTWHLIPRQRDPTQLQDS